MADQAKVTSIDALESFRASIIVFLTKANNSLDQIGDEIRRTRSWIQHEQRLHWEGEVRRRTKLLEQAEQELFSARLIRIRENLAAQQAAVHKAKRALEEAQEKLHKVKLWNRDFDTSLEPLAKSLNGLREYLVQDMPKGLAYLVQAQKILEAYGETPPASALVNPPVETSGTS